MKNHRNVLKTLTAVAMILAAAPLAAAPGEVTTADPMVRPESIAAGPDGSIYLGALAKAVIYRAKPGAEKSELFIDMSADKAVAVLGVLADGATSTLWVCEIMSFDRNAAGLTGHTTLRAFDLASGSPKGSYPLPDATNLCNDATVGPDKALYVTDTSGAKILRLRPGATTFETVIQNSSLYGADGIAFLGNTLYVDTVFSNAIFRVPMDATGKLSGPPVQVLVPRVLHSPDGMRAAGNRLFLAENTGNQVDVLTIADDKASITTVKTGFVDPTAVQPLGDTLWVGDRGQSKAIALPMPK